TFVLGVSRYDRHFYDAVYYQLEAQQVATGHGFTDPFRALTQPHAPPLPSAVHPPLTVLVLTPVAWATDGSSLAMRFTMVVLGSITVLLVGLLGREIAGTGVGLVAATIAAIYPNLWVNDGLIMSETVTALTVVGALLLTYKLVRRPRLLTAAGLGAVCGLATLARAEVVLLAPLLAGWLLISKRLATWRSRLTSAAAVLVGSGLVIAPWFGYNLARFQDTTFVSTNDGIALLGSNCHAAYYGTAVGSTSLSPGDCLPVNAPPGDDSAVARVYRDRAFTYMGAHLQRLPVVLAARVGRDWSLFRPQDAVSETEGRPWWATEWGLAVYYPLLALAIGGAVVLWRRRAPVWPLLVPPIIVILSTAVSYGQLRFRVEAEPVLVVLASVALAAIFSRWRRRRRGRPLEQETTEASGAPSRSAWPAPLTLRQRWAAAEPG
ncbi:MAG TPA: glycosyltransferase family 39 protein, partial [Acidimicrobiales bacterium]|nr:glycosyltransferase family 39 protein [Acidimicrobiales bacterium]